MKKITLLLAILLLFGTACQAAPAENSAPPSPPGETESAGPEAGESAVPEVAVTLADYPDPWAVSACAGLTDDQRVAYDAIAAAVADLCENGWQPDKTYPLDRRVSWFDYKLARNIFCANFAVLEDLLGELLEEDSQGGMDYVDRIRWYGGNERAPQYYREFQETWQAADQVLASLRYDGTEYGLAEAIARWVAENVAYAYDSDQRLEDKCNTAYAALVRHDAVCDGYAKAFDLLCKRAGLETIYVNTFSMMHAWNMIRLDGAWYHIDTTWMSTDPWNAGYYFLMPDELCYRTHEVPEYYTIQSTGERFVPQAPAFCRRWFAERDLALNSVQEALDRMAPGAEGWTEPALLWFDDPMAREAFLSQTWELPEGEDMVRSIVAEAAQDEHVVWVSSWVTVVE